MDEWYYAKDGQQLGPVSKEQVESFLADGTISGDSLVWKDGMGDWKPASEIFSDDIVVWKILRRADFV